MQTAHDSIGAHESGVAEFGEAEWRVRCDLAACYRAFVLFGWTDLIYTHVSARHPTEADRYLINPYGLLFDEIVASNLIVVDFEGRVVCGDHPVNDAGHPIHQRIGYRQPPHVRRLAGGVCGLHRSGHRVC